MSASGNIGTQITEEHLTCIICFNKFTKPKALPCLHTFCESCLHDYVVSRNYESHGKFPCPICRMETHLPSLGIQAFPDNHLVASLSDTVNQLEIPRPVPKPRKSLGQVVDGNSASWCSPSGATTDSSQMSQSKFPVSEDIDIHCSSGPDDFQMVDEQVTDYCPNQVDESPPPYSSVADTHPDKNHHTHHHKVCSNDTDSSWMVVVGSKSNTSTTNSNQHHKQAGIPASIGWNVNPLESLNPPTGQLPNYSNHPQNTVSDLSRRDANAPLYPNIPMNSDQNIACSENLMLRFGKQGSTAGDFIKPLGLAISKDGHYIISDSGGDQNRFLIFNSGGEITRAFKCGCPVRDIAVTQNNELIAAIQKANTGFRRFDFLNCQLKGEFGRFFTFEEVSGIAELNNKGIVLTGVSGHCIYVLTDQMKLQTKFGRKGNGDGYFSHPGYVAVNSKNHILVSDKANSCIQVFNIEGKFKLRFGSSGTRHGQLELPMGICVDSADNIIIADSGNFRVEVFSSRGNYLSSVIRDTWQLGENVRPVNVAVTPTGKIAVLLQGPYFAEVRVFSSRHKEIQQDQQSLGGFPVSLESAMNLPRSLGIWPANK